MLERISPVENLTIQTRKWEMRESKFYRLPSLTVTLAWLWKEIHESLFTLCWSEVFWIFKLHVSCLAQCWLTSLFNTLMSPTKNEIFCHKTRGRYITANCELQTSSPFPATVGPSCSNNGVWMDEGEKIVRKGSSGKRSDSGTYSTVRYVDTVQYLIVSNVALARWLVK